MTTTTWHLTNRNKRGIALDLKSLRATEVVERLVEWADVLVVKFPHPVRKRLNLTYESPGAFEPTAHLRRHYGLRRRGP